MFKEFILMSNIYSKSLNFDDPQLKRGGMHVKIFAVRYRENIEAVYAIGRLVAEEHLELFPTNLASSVLINPIKHFRNMFLGHPQESCK